MEKINLTRLPNHNGLQECLFLKRHNRVRRLTDWYVDSCWGRYIQTFLVDIADDAYDPARYISKLRTELFVDLDIMANRRCARPPSSGHCLIDDRHGCASGEIVRAKEPPRVQWDPQCIEEVAGYGSVFIVVI